MKNFVFIFFLLAITTSSQRADFFREDITFRLDSTYFDVEGYYWFANHFAEMVKSEIFYPFPNGQSGTIDSIRLYNISSGNIVGYKKEGSSGISFLMSIDPFDTLLFQIGYRQKIIGDSAIYILRTTQGWGKPILLAEYKLIVPDSFRLKQFTYQPDKSYKMEKFIIYYWRKDNFMPDKEMIFSF